MMNVNEQDEQEEWRKIYVYPLEKMFRKAGIFFTTDIFNMEGQLEDLSKETKLIGNFSMSQKMEKLVSKEAADLYRKMLKNPYPRD